MKGKQHSGKNNFSLFEVREREVSVSASTVSVTCSSDVTFGMRGIRYGEIIWPVQGEAWSQLFLYGAIQGRDVQSKSNFQITALKRM